MKMSVEELNEICMEMIANAGEGRAKVYEALEENGFFILTDYFALSEEEEVLHRQELRRLMEREGAQAGELYHYDTPLTVEHEIEALHAAGFGRVEILGRWGPTCTLRSDKGPGG